MAGATLAAGQKPLAVVLEFRNTSAAERTALELSDCWVGDKVPREDLHRLVEGREDLFKAHNRSLWAATP